MIKFGRRFFFDKVYSKKNYTTPIIIGGVLIATIITTFLITNYFKSDKMPEKKIKVVFKDKIDVEIYEELPSIEKYIKKIENIEYKDFNLIYPDDLVTIIGNENCSSEQENPLGIPLCEEKKVVSSLGKFKIIITSEKFKDEKSVTLNVIDTIKPNLEVKDVTITEGTKYQINDFISKCNDNSKLDCTYEYAMEKDKDGKDIDFSKYTTPGEYKIKLIAKDTSGNTSDIQEAKLIINKKKTEIKPNNNSSEKPKSCKYGDLSYSKSYVIATPIDNKECAISKEEANDLSNKAAIIHNKKLVKEIQEEYLKNAISNLNLEGKITYDITYGPVFNKSNKGVVGYYLLSEASQTINGKTTILARYFIDKTGNKVWKVNALNLK